MGVSHRLAIFVCVSVLWGCSPKPEASGPPDWAYPMKPDATTTAPTPVDTTLYHVPDSKAAFYKADVKNLASAPDWHPEDHPFMPEVVVHGGGNGAPACGYCHLPTGAGRPENASIAGLPRSYIIAQMEAFRDGSRKSSVHRAPAEVMAKAAVATSGKDTEAAADYFAALKPRSFVRVVETQRAPWTELAAWILKQAPSGGTEPMGSRIVEIPDDFERFELRDNRASFTAYVPVGSVQKGKMLVTNAGTEGVACTACHGTDLKGLGEVPGIAGRSPTYIVRQLYDFQSGARANPGSAPMKPISEALTAADRINIAAYLGSLQP
jgi:cytochrome c553